MDVDINCDLGEGSPHDADLMPLITSANICCGAHAGSDACILRALALARAHGVQVGAHPGFADREHFGRRELPLGVDKILELATAQVEHLRGLGADVKYVKPHGALYNMACRESAYAWPLMRLGLPIMGLPGSALEAQCAVAHVPFIPEGFADRRYKEDGSLVPRGQPGAFVESPAEAVEQARRLIETHGIMTLCVHGDNPEAVLFVRILREALSRSGFEIRSFEIPCALS